MTGVLLDLTELQGVDHFVVGKGVGDDDEPTAGLAPVFDFQGLEGMGDGLFGVF